MSATNIITLSGRAIYLEPSPHETDGGNLIGRDPRLIDLDDLRVLGHPESPIKAIRAKCLDCSGSQPSEVRKCVSKNCGLWPFRMGKNPFWGKASGNETSQENGADLSVFLEGNAS